MKDVFLVILGLGCIILGLENHSLRNTVDGIESRYAAFLGKKVNGYPLAESIKEGTLGVFKTKDKAIICGQAISLDRPLFP